MATFPDVLSVQDFVSQEENNLEITADYSYEDIPTQGAVTTNLFLQKNPTGMDVEGKASGVLLPHCDRCCESFNEPFSIEFDEKYVFNRYTSNLPKELELKAEDFFEAVDPEGNLDLKDLVRQFLVIELSTPKNCGHENCSSQIFSDPILSAS